MHRAFSHDVKYLCCLAFTFNKFLLEVLEFFKGKFLPRIVIFQRKVFTIKETNLFLFPDD